MQKEIIILLTATITPGEMPNTLLNNPKDRLKQYCSSLDYYLNKTKCKILFVENSGTDISSFYKEYIDLKRLEIITFKGNNFLKSLGKGYGECLIIDHALNHSIFLKDNNTIVIKITGRLKVLNINYFLKQCLIKDFDIAAESLAHFKYTDSRFFIASIKFLKYFLNNKNQISDKVGENFEDILKKTILNSMNESMNMLFFKQIVRIQGISGTNNTDYKSSYLSWFLRNLKRYIGLSLMNLKGL